MPLEREIDLHFPKAGIDLTVKAGEWPLRWGPNREKHYSCMVGVNVRGYEPLTGRQRGGSRPGLSRWIDDTVVADWVVQHLEVVVATGIDPPGGEVQLSQSGRVVTVVTVGQGNVYVANPNDDDWTAADLDMAVGDPPLNFDGIIFSSTLNQKLFFVDGATFDTHVPVYYDPSDNTVKEWVVTEGTFPQGGDAADGDDNTPRGIETWRNRLLLFMLLDDPQNIFACRQDDAFDFDYAPATPSGQDAWALNIPDGLGFVGDIVNGICPWSEDIAIVYGDHTTNYIDGDPMAGGSIVNVSRAIGAAWGRAWCVAPDGTVYWFGNIPNVYMIQPGTKNIVCISLPIEPLLKSVNTGSNSIRLVWNDEAKGFHVFITPLVGGATTHYFFEAPRADGSGGAWWQDVFANEDHNPLVCCTVDGNESADRAVIIGSFDGYVRKVDYEATDDDGTAIATRVVIGPLLTPTMDEITLMSLQANMADGSADVTYNIRTGQNAEQALTNTPISSVAGTFSENLGYTKIINRSGKAILVDLTTTAGGWAMENIRAGLREWISDIRRRGKV